jgi:hypothetical protein
MPVKRNATLEEAVKGIIVYRNSKGVFYNRRHGGEHQCREF